MTGFSLLVVDDDIDFAESLSDALEAAGHRVVLAHSGEAGLERVQAQPFDLVLMDMKMPGMNGVETLAAMRLARPGIRSVMVTAHTRDALIQEAVSAGALAVLYKPFPMAELLGTIAFLPGRGQILLVEDDPDLREELRSLLENDHYRVACVTTVAEARQHLADNPVDLLLLEYRLPDGSGADLLDWIKASPISVPVVILSGHAEAVLDALPCFSPDDILIKPFSPAKLMERISRNSKPKT